MIYGFVHNRVDQGRSGLTDPVVAPPRKVAVEQTGLPENLAVSRDQALVAADQFGDLADVQRPLGIPKRQRDAQPVRIRQCPGSFRRQPDFVDRSLRDPTSLGLIARVCNALLSQLSDPIVLK